MSVLKVDMLLWAFLNEKLSGQKSKVGALYLVFPVIVIVHYLQCLFCTLDITKMQTLAKITMIMQGGLDQVQSIPPWTMTGKISLLFQKKYLLEVTWLAFYKQCFGEFSFGVDSHGPGVCVKYFLSFPPKNLSPEKTKTNLCSKFLSAQILFQDFNFNLESK